MFDIYQAKPTRNCCMKGLTAIKLCPSQSNIIFYTLSNQHFIQPSQKLDVYIGYILDEMLHWFAPIFKVFSLNLLKIF